MLSKITKFKSIFLIVTSIVLGLVIGSIILLLAHYNPLQVYSTLFVGIFAKPKYILWTLLKATPIIMTGLSVAFAFRIGMFNIGAEGQYMIGALLAVICGYYLDLNSSIHPIIIIIIAMLGAGIFGGIAGYLKIKFDLNEVISTIMLNWIAFYFYNYMIDTPFLNKGMNVSHKIKASAKLTIISSNDFLEKTNTFLYDLEKVKFHWGFFIAIILAVICWIILEKTTLEFQMKAVGLNPNASEHAGIDIKRNKILGMFIAGALAGAGGAIQVLGVNFGITTLAAMQGLGFEGIAVALVANSSPIGCIFSGLLFGGLRYGATKIQVPPISAPSEIINVIIGMIVLFIAVPKIIEVLIRNRGEQYDK
ncbi:ABC transporter permease [Fusibacter ferrireducens]|uniref:ABC transporter permease n=1 Tax=Fusibacter ferrireducens TaxID=2785058 RepID=A0ABR9ZMB9_9FIRM|nr:ABC transporter permease [Fusibacter ferrireducens]MBF4691574.1 ABC transporter permease [Fusibacter ferrireducens]